MEKSMGREGFTTRTVIDMKETSKTTRRMAKVLIFMPQEIDIKVASLTTKWTAAARFTAILVSVSWGNTPKANAMAKALTTTAQGSACKASGGATSTSVLSVSDSCSVCV